MAAVWGSASNSGNTFDPNTNNRNPDFEIYANPGQFSLSRGHSSNVTINVSSIAGFTGNVTLSCAGPTGDPGVTCSFANGVVTPGSNGATSVLTVTASTSASLHRKGNGLLPRSPSSNPWQLFGGGFTLAALFLFGLPGQRRRLSRTLGKHAHGGMLALLLLAVCTGAMLGCGSTPAKTTGGGGGGSGTGTLTPPSTGPTLNISSYVTVNATASGNSTASHVIEIVYTLQ
jgi:hypothetical protein